MIRVPKTKKGLLAYIFAVFILTFSVFQTSNTKVARKSLLAPSPSPLSYDSQLVLGENTEEFEVTRVIDGDTFEINSGLKVRFIGIDAPETKDPRKPVSCFGKEAFEFANSRLLGKRVRLIKDVSEKDVYGRLLRYVYLGDEFFNETLVKEGYAFARSYPPDISMQKQLKDSELKASFEKRGLWGEKCSN